VGARPTLSGAYLDASAVVKLLIAEAETDALHAFLTDWPLRISRELMRVELACVCHRHRLAADAVDDLLEGLRLLPLTPATLRGACQAFSPRQRALDALHLAAAAGARDHIGCFISYDGDRLAAAAALGWRTEHPGL
jgi:predicted nucleic acid-binding protein